MTKYITIKLTEDQAKQLHNLLYEYGNLVEGLTDAEIAFTQRLDKKIGKALAKAKTV